MEWFIHHLSALTPTGAYAWLAGILLLDGGAGRRHRFVPDGPLVWAAHPLQPVGQPLLHAPPPAPRPRVLPQVRQPGGVPGPYHACVAVLDLLLRGDAAPEAVGVLHLRRAGGRDVGACAGVQ